MKLSYLIGMGALILAPAFASQVGVIDTEALIRNHPRFGEVEKMLRTSFEQKSNELSNAIGQRFGKETSQLKELESKVTKLQAEITDLRDKKSSPKAINKAIADYQVAYKAYEDYRAKVLVTQNEYNTKKNQLQSEQDQLEQNARVALLKDIQEKTNKFAKANGYNLVIDNTDVVFIDETDNLTDKMSEFLKNNP